MKTRAELTELARGYVERHLAYDEDASADAIYEEAYTLALDALAEMTGLNQIAASEIAMAIAQSYAQT